MAGRTPYEAVENFLSPLQSAVSFVARSVLVASGREPAAEPHTVTFGNGEPARLRADRRLYLRFIHRYWITQTDDPGRGPWKASTAEYNDELLADDEQRIVAFHWHPHSRSAATWPHLHLPSGTPFELREKHPPTGRVSVESVLRFALLELGVHAMRDEWREALQRSEQAFPRYRSGASVAAGRGVRAEPWSGEDPAEACVRGRFLQTSRLPRTPGPRRLVPA